MFLWDCFGVVDPLYPKPLSLLLHLCLLCSQGSPQWQFPSSRRFSEGVAGIRNCVVLIPFNHSKFQNLGFLVSRAMRLLPLLWAAQS